MQKAIQNGWKISGFGNKSVGANMFGKKPIRVFNASWFLFGRETVTIVGYRAPGAEINTLINIAKNKKKADSQNTESQPSL